MKSKVDSTQENLWRTWNDWTTDHNEDVEKTSGEEDEDLEGKVSSLVQGWREKVGLDERNTSWPYHRPKFTSKVGNISMVSLCQIYTSYLKMQATYMDLLQFVGVRGSEGCGSPDFLEVC